MRLARGYRSVVALAACLACGCAQAQPKARPAQLCPLSDEQTQKSIDAFAKLVPTYHHPRCERCHGALDVFAENTPHGGGVQGDETGCDACHTEGLQGERWMTPSKGHNFVGKDAKTLCKQMHEAEQTGAEFMKHLSTDKLIAVAFIGTRALTEKDREDEKVAIEKPPVGKDEFLRLAQTWLDATGGDFKGEEDCGCEPQHYAVRVSYKRDVKMGIVTGTNQMGPVDVPIKFHDDGTFDGQQTVYFNGNVTALVCTGTSTASMTLKVSGDVSGQVPNEAMSLKIENTTLMKGKATAVCPEIGQKTATTNGGEKANVAQDDIPANVGVKPHFDPGSSGVITTSIDAEIVQLDH